MSKTDLLRTVRKLIKIAQSANAERLSDHEVTLRLERRLESQSRRTFLIGASALIATACTTGLATGARALTAEPSVADPMASEPVVILGAGAAGLSAAYRLKKQKIPFLLIDAQSRVGGRIWTAPNFNADGQFTEIGGELVDSAHLVLRALVKELSLSGHEIAIEDFAPGDVGLDKGVFLIDGKVYSHAQFIEGVRPLCVKLAKSSKEMWLGGNPDADTICYQTANPRSPKFKLKNAMKYDRLTVREFLHSIHKDVEPWVVKLIDQAYLGEYGLETDQQSAINLLSILNQEVGPNGEFEMFGSSDEISRVKGGSETLIRALHQAISQMGANGQILLDQKLIQIAHKNGRFELKFAGLARTLRPKQVICTIPFSVLRNVDGALDLALSHQKKAAIQEFAMGTNAKVFLSFNERVWRTPPSSLKLAPINGAIFSNSASQAFWETSRMQNGQRGILTNFLGGKNGALAGEHTVQTALNDLGKIYPEISRQFEPRTSDLVPALKGVRQTINWTKNPFTLGSYGCLRPGQWTSFWGSCGETEMNQQLFFAGEHTSLPYQGFMEGAYESGLRAAEAVVASRTGAEPVDPYVWAKSVLADGPTHS